MNLIVESRPEGPTLARMTSDLKEMMNRMGLREADFLNLSAEISFPEGMEPEKPCQVIRIYGVYRPIYSDATPDNACRLEVNLERFGDFWFGGFAIIDPLKNGVIAKSKRDLAYTAFTQIISKACQIGCLPSESRATWHRRAGWSDLLAEVACEA